MKLYREVGEARELMVIKVGSYSSEKKQIIGAYVDEIEITEDEISQIIKDKSAEVAERINVTTDQNIKNEVYERAFDEVARAILSKLKGE